MRKIRFIFHGRMPSEKADSLFAINDAKSFSDLGIELEMLVPRRIGIKGDVGKFYGLEVNFPIKYLPVIDGFALGLPRGFAYFITIISFSISCFIYSLFDNKSVYYSNEILPLFAISYFRKTFYEMHDYPESKKGIFGIMVRRISKILIHNRWKMYKAIGEFALDKNKIISIPNAVNLEQFDIKLSKRDARQKLGLSDQTNIVVYTGHFYSWKGADLLALTAENFGNVEFYFVGGSINDVEDFKQKYKSKNLHFVGFKPHSEIPLWQKSADCLVLPNTAKEDISKYYTSPMKLFEYMASGVPIVASKIPSIEEIVSSNEVVFFEPDDKQSLIDKINQVLQNPNESNKLTVNARNKVEDYTWDKRAKKIIDFIYE